MISLSDTMPFTSLENLVFPYTTPLSIPLFLSDRLSSIAKLFESIESNNNFFFVQNFFQFPKCFPSRILPIHKTSTGSSLSSKWISACTTYRMASTALQHRLSFISLEFCHQTSEPLMQLDELPGPITHRERQL